MDFLNHTKKDERKGLALKLSPEIFDYVKKQSERLGISMSDFIKLKINNQLREETVQ